MGRATRSGRGDALRDMSSPAFPASLPMASLTSIPMVGGEAGSTLPCLYQRADQKYGFNLVSGVLTRPPRFFSRVKLQSDRRVLRDLFQPGATPLCFSTNNSTLVLIKNQEVWRDSVRSGTPLRAAPAIKYAFMATHQEE